MNANELTVSDHRVQIIDETPHNMLVKIAKDDGETNTLNVARNPRNELLYKHGMYKLVHGEPGLIIQFKDSGLEVQTTEEGGVYVITGDRDPVHTSPEHERRLLDAIKTLKETGDDTPLSELYHHILDTQIRRHVVNRLFDVRPFSVLADKGLVEADPRGWLFHDSLLLTWEGEFRNDTRDTTYSVSGSAVREVESVNEAFTLSVDQRGTAGTAIDQVSDEVSRHSVEIDGQEYTFGKRETQFVAKAVWAVKNVRPRGGA